jgi:hypothetical protein
MAKSSLNSTKARPSFMIGELVVVDHQVIMVVNRAKDNGDELGPTEFRGVIIHSNPTTWSQNVGIEDTFWKEDARLYVGTVTLEND